MLWKILSGISAACLLAGAVFSYFNKEALHNERARDKSAQDNLTAVKQEITKTTDVKERKTKDLADLEKQREVAKTQVAKANEDIAVKQQEVDTLKKNLDAVTKQVAKIEDQIQKAGDIEKLAAQVEGLQKEMKDTEAAIANQEQQKAIAEKELAIVQAEYGHLKNIEKRQKAGIVEPGFTARVSQVFPQYGFVVLNKGNLAGMFARASLEVKRGHEVVARLTVREVEQGMSVADLVPGSLVSGETIRNGDLVVASSKQPKLQEEQAVAAAASISAPAAAPKADAAAGMAAPAADIFGSTAPAPAAAAAAATADPAATGTPTNPRTDDAFAPAGAAPAKPATADPFAPPAK